MSTSSHSCYHAIHYELGHLHEKDSHDMISGKTKILGLVGNPVAQVKMPGYLNPHLESIGQDIALVPFDVSPEHLEHYVGVLRHGANFLGSLVTVPHKQAFAGHVDHLSERAQALGAINVVRRDADGSLHGDHTDGFGFLNASRRHGFTPAGRSALVVGVGGAGSAIAHALCEAGVKRLCIVDVDQGRLQAMKGLLGRSFPKVDLQTEISTLAGLDLVLNATAVGMRAEDPLPLSGNLLDTLQPTTLVGDVVTAPAETPLLHFARHRGCRIQKGAEMAKASMGFIGGFFRVMPSIDPLAAILAPLSDHTNQTSATKE